MLTREYDPYRGWYNENAAFRSYSDPAVSSADWWRLMQAPRYAPFLSADSVDSGIAAIGQSGYATDPAYADKLRRMEPRTPQQLAFYRDRKAELVASGAPDHLAEVGAKQAALETGWGKSAPGNNYYGIKAGGRPMQLAQAGTPDVPQGLLRDNGGQETQAMPNQETGLLGGSLERLMSDPLFLMGTSILASNDEDNAGRVIGKGLLGGTAAWRASQQSRALEEQRRLQIEMARQRQIEEQQKLQQQQDWLRGLGGVMPGMGGQPGAAPSAQDIALHGLRGAVIGVPGAQAAMQYGLGMRPYESPTVAQANEERNRQFEREVQLLKLRDEGKLPPDAAPGMAGTPAAAGGPAMAPGMAPAQAREVYQKGAESLLTLDAERLKSLNERAGAAGRMLPSVKRMLTQNAQAPSGRLAPAQVWAGQVAESIDNWFGTGFKSWFGGDATIATAEQFFADAANLIREQIKALGSGNAISNVDLLFTRETLPGLMQTKEGRQKMLEALQSDMENLQMTARQADTYFRANKGRGLEGFEAKDLKRPSFLKRYFVVGPNGERYEMANKAAADSVVQARQGFSVVEE